MKIIGFLPLRAGSKGIKNKNRNSFLGKALYKWTLNAMIESESFTDIWISTDDSVIIETEKDNPKVNIHYRSKLVSDDSATTESVMEEFIKQHSYTEKDIFILVQATNPFITKVDYRNAISDFIKHSICTKDKNISMVSVVENKRFIWNGMPEHIQALNYDPINRKRRQDLNCSSTYIENGAFYISYIGSIKKYHCRLTNQVIPYIMGQESYHEIDESIDWIICERIKKYLNEVGNK